MDEVVDYIDKRFQDAIEYILGCYLQIRVEAGESRGRGRGRGRGSLAEIRPYSFRACQSVSTIEKLANQDQQPNAINHEQHPPAGRGLALHVTSIFSDRGRHSKQRQALDLTLYS